MVGWSERFGSKYLNGYKFKASWFSLCFLLSILPLSSALSVPCFLPSLSFHLFIEHRRSKLHGLTFRLW